MTATADSKAHVRSARGLAKALGVEVLGWNDKPGKEFISTQGDGDKLEALRKELVKAGWHVWPVAERQEGSFMDFGVRPPPVRAPLDQGGMTAVDLPSEAVNSNTFHYRGPGGLYLNNLLWCSMLLLMVWIAGVKRIVTHSVTGWMAFWWLVVALILLVLHWVEISGDEKGLTIRKHFFGKHKVVPFSNIKQAKVFKDQQQRTTKSGKVIKNGWVTWYLTVNVKSGKSFDLLLSKKRLADLAAFIKPRIAA